MSGFLSRRKAELKPSRKPMSRVSKKRQAETDGRMFLTLKPGGRLPKVGKRGRVWINTRRSLKAEFFKAGVTTCEGRWEGCRVDDELGFAHSLKRRHITDETLMREVALLCNRCHDRIELMGEAMMCRRVRQLIERRAYMLAA